MAEAKRKQTLLEVVQPLVSVFNFIYGFNLGDRKPPGCAKRLRKRLQKLVVWAIFIFNLFLYYADRVRGRSSAFEGRWLAIVAIFCCSFYLFAFDETEMERLVFQLEGYGMGKMSARATSKMAAVGLLTMALLLAPWLLNVARAIPNASLFSLIFNPRLYQKLNSNDCLFAMLYLGAIFLCLFVLAMGILSFFGFLFSVFNACLGCAVAAYCPSRLDDHIEDIRSFRSPLRRTRLLSNLCYEYYRLQPLLSMTNSNMATTMSLLKIFTMFLWVICVHCLEQMNTLLLVNIPFLQFSIPLLMYLVVAPTANDMRYKLFEGAAEVLMVDDQWQSHDPTSRSLLIKMRLNLLKHLVHVRMDRGPFTLLGDSVDPGTLFMIFVEINDLRTVIR